MFFIKKKKDLNFQSYSICLVSLCPEGPGAAMWFEGNVEASTHKCWKECLSKDLHQISHVPDKPKSCHTYEN